mgnify:CR=1 FL=1
MSKMTLFEKFFSGSLCFRNCADAQNVHVVTPPRTICNRYTLAADAGHSNAESVIDALRNTVNASSEDNAKSDDLEAQWWGTHLQEVVATVSNFQSTHDAAAFSTHDGHPLRGSTADPFLSGPACHFSALTLKMQYRHSQNASTGAANTTASNTSSFDISICEPVRVDGCAESIWTAAEYQRASSLACESRLQGKTDNELVSSLAYVP